jgi:hypothetical protein
MAHQDSRDFPHNTVATLLIVLERRDLKNRRTCAVAVLRSAFDHLFKSYRYPTAESGEAMCTLLVLAGEL